MSDEMGSINPRNEDVIYGQDGDQYIAHRPDFINLQESPCGFGDTEEEAKSDLIKQESTTAEGFLCLYTYFEQRKYMLKETTNTKRGQIK